MIGHKGTDKTRDDKKTEKQWMKDTWGREDTPELSEEDRRRRSNEALEKGEGRVNQRRPETR